MDKFNFETKDGIEKNVEKIAEIFPSAVTEGKINFDTLRTLLGDEVAGDERYEFTWVGKKEAMREAGRPIRKTLRPCPEESKNWEDTENLYIEGDNLEVLKLLQESYLGKIKMIYIDPPYNTGNDYVYKDDFSTNAEEYQSDLGVFSGDGYRLFLNPDTNGRYHSDWCNMIYPRLILSRNLLSEDGTIFISIDDHEVENLKKICDEVFGARNFIAQWNWFKSATPPNLSKKVKKNIEYIICYEKNKNNIKYKGIQKTSASNNGLMNQTNPIGVLDFPAHIVETNLSNGHYKSGSFGTKSYDIDLLKDTEVRDGYFIKEVSLRGKFKWSQENLLREIEKGTTISIKSNAFSPSYEKTEYEAEAPPNLIDRNVCVGTTENAGEQLDLLFDGVSVFLYPKPVSLIDYLIGFNDDENGVILDFFSGSATTGHAVMGRNATYGGNRKFILVQYPEVINPEKASTPASKSVAANAVELLSKTNKPYNISEIGKERIRRAGEMIKERRTEENKQVTLGEDPKPIPDIGFRVFKVDESNMKDVYYSAEEYKQIELDQLVSNIKEDRTDMDLLFACLLDWGLPLSMPHYQEEIDGVTVHTYNNGDLIACFANDISEQLVRKIASRQPLRVVFRDSSFANSPSKINVEEIFKLLAPNTSIRVL